MWKCLYLLFTYQYQLKPCTASDLLAWHKTKFAEAAMGKKFVTSHYDYLPAKYSVHLTDPTVLFVVIKTISLHSLFLSKSTCMKSTKKTPESLMKLKITAENYGFSMTLN